MKWLRRGVMWVFAVILVLLAKPKPDSCAQVNDDPVQMPPP